MRCKNYFTLLLCMLLCANASFSKLCNLANGNPVNVTFNESAENNGFDDTTTPKCLIVPMANPLNTKTVAVEIDPASSASAVAFNVKDTTKATCSPSTATSGNQTVTMTSVAKGTTVLEAKVDSAGCNTLNIVVKEKEEVSVALFFVTTAGYSTTVSVSDADAIISNLNGIFTPQANIVFTKNSASVLTLPDLGSSVDFNLTSTDEWDDIVAIGGMMGADLNIYYVWDLTEHFADGSEDSGYWGYYLGTDCMIVNGAPSKATPHEVGHVLGIINHNSTDARALMWEDDEYDGIKIFKAEADLIN